MGKKFDSKQMDLDNLDAIIRNCEEAMVGRFKKKPEADDATCEHCEGKGCEECEAEEDGGEKPDLEGADLEDLMRLYEEEKGRED